MREQLAALAHAQWVGWMTYLFEKSRHNDDGTVTIPAWAVLRWKRQVVTPYHDLPEEEKESDRAEADKVRMIVGDRPVPIGEVTIHVADADTVRTVVEATRAFVARGSRATSVIHGTTYCICCQAETLGPPQPLVHEHDCAWVVARKALEALDAQPSRDAQRGS